MRILGIVLLLLLSLNACGDNFETTKTESLRIAVTTSTRDSGLLDALLPTFEKGHNTRVDVLAVGTGAALELGRTGDVDLIIVHARDAELKFMAEGAGVRHEPLFTNPFVIAGPKNDPSKIAGLPPKQALLKLRDSGAKYVSRGDDSGTNRKEKALFSACSINKLWTDCVESGRGMGATLTMANQMQAYVLTDRATFLRFKSKTDLKIYVENSDKLDNPYSAIVVSEKLRGMGKISAAQKLCDFLVSEPTRAKITAFECEGEHPFSLLQGNGG
ncbi:MAG: tungstate transport system substrate-binding protein [Planctomycetota bacterium]